MKVITISGTQGSGKTRLIRELVLRAEALGKRSAVLVNEDGQEDYDRDFVEKHQLHVERLRGG